MRRDLQTSRSVLVKSTLIQKLACGMGENYYAMSNAADAEARDFFRCEYEAYKQKYNAELFRMRSKGEKA